jgi:hypothetical protein
LNNLLAFGGDDFPEAVLDGMRALCSLNWTKDSHVKRYILHIFQAPPHGKIFKDAIYDDDYPDGCPCGLNHTDIISCINSTIENLHYIVYPLTNYVNKAIQLF